MQFFFFFEKQNGKKKVKRGPEADELLLVVLRGHVVFYFVQPKLKFLPTAIPTEAHRSLEWPLLHSAHLLFGVLNIANINIISKTCP